MYPGAGTFVLIRPAQTFYERIKNAVRDAKRIAVHLHYAVAALTPTLFSTETNEGPHCLILANVLHREDPTSALRFSGISRTEAAL